MGYDMYVITPDPKAVAGTAKAHEAFLAACRKRDEASKAGSPPDQGLQDAVEAAYAAMSAADTNYFRLNAWGMGEAREVMSRLGMLTDHAHPEWPQTPLSDEVREDLDECFDGQPLPADVAGMRAEWDAYVTKNPRTEHNLPASDIGDDQLAEYRTFMTLYREALTSHGDEPGLPAHKLCSNDGWIVTPEECESVYGIWRALPWSSRRDIKLENDWFEDWMKFFKHAAKLDGFRVY